MPWVPGWGGKPGIIAGAGGSPGECAGPVSHQGGDYPFGAQSQGCRSSTRQERTCPAAPLPRHGEDLQRIDQGSPTTHWSTPTSAVIFEGLAASTHDGKPASRAIVDEDDDVIEAVPAVAKEAWNVMMACYKISLTESVTCACIRVLQTMPQKCK